MLEILGLVLGQDRGRERAKPFPMFDARVEDIFHVGQAGMCDDRAIPERARSPFHPPLKPTDYVSVRNLPGDFRKQGLAVELPILQFRFLQVGLNTIFTKFRS